MFATGLASVADAALPVATEDFERLRRRFSKGFAIVGRAAPNAMPFGKNICGRNPKH